MIDIYIYVCVCVCFLYVCALKIFSRCQIVFVVYGNQPCSSLTPRNSITIPECSPTQYGKDCSEDCSRGCREGKCDHVTGQCTLGCDDGWFEEPKCERGEFVVKVSSVKLSEFKHVSSGCNSAQYKTLMFCR